MEKGSLLREWKTADAVPLFKKGDLESNSVKYWKQ